MKARPPRSATVRVPLLRDAEKTRAAILQAAAREFASEGLAGARTESIARAAGINKALIHYYFKDKQTLYGAVLEQVFSSLATRMDEVLDQDLPPGEKILAYAAAHFDFIAASPVYPRLVQREMMRDSRSTHLRRMVRRYLRPLQEKLFETLRQGIASGEFRKINPQHFILSMVAMNVFYFSSVLFITILAGGNPLAPGRVAERKAAVLDVLSAALFMPGNAQGKSTSVAKEKS